MNWISEFFNSILLALHLICMNIGVGGAFLALYWEWKASREPRLHPVMRSWAFVMFKSLLIGVLIGILHGWLMWSGAFGKVVMLTGSRLTAGIGEMSVSFILMLVYWLWVKRADLQKTGWGWKLRFFMVIFASTNLLYHFPFFFETVIWLARPENLPKEALTSRQFAAKFVEPEILFRSLHFVIASFAVTGVAAMFIGKRVFNKAQNLSDASEKQASSTFGQGLIKTGAHWVLWPSLCQIPVGVLVTIYQEKSTALRITNVADPIFWIFSISIVLALLLMHRTAKAAFGSEPQKHATAVMHIMITVIVLMSFVSRQSRAWVMQQDDFAGKPIPQATKSN